MPHTKAICRDHPANRQVTALLIHGQPYSLHTLKLALDREGIESHHAWTLEEAVHYIQSENPPHLIFTRDRLMDENWVDVVTLAARATWPVNVIVVASHTNEVPWLQVIECGAFDLLIPPLTGRNFNRVLYRAVEDILA